MTRRLLQVLPSVIRRVESQLEIDVDFCESLKSCVEDFDQISVACPITTETRDTGLGRSRPVRELPWRSHIEIIPLPKAYDLLGFIRNYRTVSQLLKSEIEKAQYLLFAPHTLIGDWPTVAAHEAIKLKRHYAIEADVVYESVARIGWSRDATWKRAIKERIMLPLFRQSFRYCLRHSTLALFQGQDVYDAYTPFSRNAHKVYHHIPVYKDDHITEAALQRKLDRLDRHEALKICYVGRVIDMKGPMDWLNTIYELTRRGVDLRAVWLGDGSLLPSLRVKIASLRLNGRVSLPGFTSNREEIVRTLKDSDIFLFCHKTRESARCLGEALACGCPIVGYGSAYPEELVAQFGGGKFAALGDWKQLVDMVQDFDKNRGKLREMIKSASLSGRSFDRRAQLKNRIALIMDSLDSAAS